MKPKSLIAQPDPILRTRKLLRMERLSKNVLLCLFAGRLAAVDFQQKPETLHFGFTLRNSHYYKSDKGPIVWKAEGGKRVVDIAKLKDMLSGELKESYHPAKFGLDMIEGVERVRFQLKI